ncbi:hypothetical protein B0T16DRAFT_421020 [Cercophora newfieldiana]|uniref:Uncharacterized protein n=1 Tax=Cercophora newfieldiana TaxID=92897 RepID=A0AA40CKB5_9PEZI|nr:hypothetical protein B0T16DRAFT_421020 [Cercophora newfieldiana]
MRNREMIDEVNRTLEAFDKSLGRLETINTSLHKQVEQGYKQRDSVRAATSHYAATRHAHHTQNNLKVDRK